jgi:D-cysteine desulfhydrase
VLEQRVAGSYDPRASGNNFLFDLLGVEDIVVTDAGADLNAAMQSLSDELRKQGRKPYVIPGGGSNGLGALGYVACAEEILAQGFEYGVAFDHVVCTSGSAGTQAGLLVGLHAANAQLPLIGISIRRARAEQEALVYKLTLETAALLGVVAPPADSVRVFDDWVGPGYSLPTPDMVDAVRLTARLENVLLDPVYTGKAMAGLIGLAARGAFGRDERVLFVHTGGMPSLFAYQSVLQRS